jgi:hypothetical protein
VKPKTKKPSISFFAYIGILLTLILGKYQETLLASLRISSHQLQQHYVIATAPNVALKLS